MIEVQTVAIDDLVRAGGLPTPDVVKIDVEGAEIAVLEGMRETIDRHRPAIICELHDTHAEFVTAMKVSRLPADQPRGDNPRWSRRAPTPTPWPCRRSIPATDAGQCSWALSGVPAWSQVSVSPDSASPLSTAELVGEVLVAVSSVRTPELSVARMCSVRAEVAY